MLKVYWFLYFIYFQKFKIKKMER